MNDDMQLNQEQDLTNDNEDRLCTDLTVTEQRSLIFHLLYALDAFEYDISLDALVDNFKKGFGIIIPSDSDVFTTTLSISEKKDELDKTIMPLIENWAYDRLGVATKLILRLGAWELEHTDTDPAVIINEAVELAKCFGEKDSYKFINGILDEYNKRRQK